MSMKIKYYRDITARNDLPAHIWAYREDGYEKCVSAHEYLRDACGNEIFTWHYSDGINDWDGNPYWKEITKKEAFELCL